MTWEQEQALRDKQREDERIFSLRYARMGAPSYLNGCRKCGAVVWRVDLHETVHPQDEERNWV